MECVVIHADFADYRLLTVTGLLDISLQRAQQLVRANYIFFWQLIPPASIQPARNIHRFATCMKDEFLKNLRNRYLDGEISEPEFNGMVVNLPPTGK
jgi:hypothetical protein